MIKKLLSVWYFVRAGNYIDAGDPGLAFRTMKKVRALAGSAYHKTSLFEMNLRMALAAKMCARYEIALDEIQQAKHKIAIAKSINEREREYLTIFCKLLEYECMTNAIPPAYKKGIIQELVHDQSIAIRFKKSYPIEA
jgi:hypothetical protein